MQQKQVVTSFLIHESPEGDHLLLLRRSDRVKTHKGRWAGVSGYLEPGATPEEQARTEIAEEVGLGPEEVCLLTFGEAVHAPDPPTDTEWIVHPFLFKVTEPRKVRLDWEHVESRWIAPEEVTEFQTVPRFREALNAVYPLEALLLARGKEVERRVARLGEDRERSAMALAREAALLLAEIARATTEVEVVERACRLVAGARPVMASVCNVALTVLGTLRSARDPLGAAARSAQRMASTLEAAPPAISRFARVYLQGTAVTLSSSSAVLDALLANRDRVMRVVVAEGRPLLEGRTLAARLAAEGMQVDLITEAQIPQVLQEADLALIGADSFLADGSAVNKVGSRLLALAARDRGVPFFVLADTLKLAPWVPEEAPPGIWEDGGRQDVWGEAPEGVQVRNVTFEAVPASLITKYVTEEGIREPEQLAALARSATRLWAELRTS